MTLKFPGATADLIATKNLFDVFLKSKLLSMTEQERLGREPEDRWLFNNCFKLTEWYYDEFLKLFDWYYLLTGGVIVWVGVMIDILWY